MTVTDARTVEERLAAIEAALYPLHVIEPSWTAGQEAEFRQAWEQANAEGFQHREFKWMPPGRVITLAPEAVSQLLRECVTVVKPGEVLVLRCPEEWTAEQAQQMQEYANLWLESNAPGVKVLTVPHVEMAVIESPERKEGTTGAAPSPALPD